MQNVGVIPARLGSERVKQKNLCPLDGKPLILYSIRAAKEARSLSEVYVNSESDLLGQIALDNGVKYYKRDAALAGSYSTSDEFNYDFMKNVKADCVVMINPVAPLITGEDIDKMVSFYLENDFDTLIPVREERLHAFVDREPANFQIGQVKSFCPAKPINFDIERQLPRTQDLKPVKICAWTVCIWRPEVFMKSYETKGHGVFSGKLGFYPQSHFKTVKISTEEDFLLAEILLQNRKKWKNYD